MYAFRASMGGVTMSHSCHCNFGHVVFRTRGTEIHPDDLLRVHGYIRGITTDCLYVCNICVLQI